MAVVCNYFGGDKQDIVFQKMNDIEKITDQLFIFRVEKSTDNFSLLFLANANGYFNEYVKSLLYDRKRHFYEMIKFDKPCIFYIDVDTKSPVSTDTEHHIISILNKLIVNLFFIEFNISVNIDNDIIILKSDAKTKLSLHILVRFTNIDIMFETNQELKKLIISLINNLEEAQCTGTEYKPLSLTKNEVQTLFYIHNEKFYCIIDKSVYNTNKLFRTLWSCKKGRCDNFNPYKIPTCATLWNEKDWLLNTLITYNRVNLNCMKLTVEKYLPPGKSINNF